MNPKIDKVGRKAMVQVNPLRKGRRDRSVVLRIAEVSTASFRRHSKSVGKRTTVPQPPVLESPVGAPSKGTIF